MKPFELPSVEIVKFDVKDVLTTSSDEGGTEFSGNNCIGGVF